MSLDAGRMLGRLAESLLTGRAFDLAVPYQQQSALGFGMLLAQIRGQLEGEAAILAEENQAMRAFLKREAAGIGDGELRQRVEAGADGGLGSLRVPDLRAANDALRSLLIDLHVYAESRPAERDLEERIWQQLLATTERRLSG